VWLGALRRLGGLFVLSSALALLGALVFGVAVGSDARRAISVAFYSVGAFLLIAGFFVGNRGPVRLKGTGGDAGGPFFLGSRFVRWASPAEREENINLSAIFFVLGFLLILVGVAADNRYEVV
jgi:hypothetical protein